MVGEHNERGLVGEHVKNLLANAYSGETTGRPEFNTAIHASDIMTFCPRKFAICHSQKIPYHLTEHVGKGLALTFEIGRKIQDIVVKRLHKNKNLIGTWQFTCCGKFSYGIHSTKCPFCSAMSLPAYKDTPLRLHLTDEVSLVGNVDAQVINNDTITSCEIKSIKRDEFVKLTEPLLPHKYQLSTYLYLLSHPDTLVLNKPIREIEKEANRKFTNKSGCVIYVPKEAVQNPFDKVFTLKLKKEIVQEITDKLLKTKKYLETKKIPKRELCKSELSMLAKTCQVRKICLGKK